jgi:hypothetical protein
MPGYIFGYKKMNFEDWFALKLSLKSHFGAGLRLVII